MYRDGIGVEKSIEKAFYWYQKAAPNGDGFARAELGNFYLNGIGVDRDVDLALKWFMASAEQGNAFAQSRLGLMYRDGVGVEKSIEKAFYWYQKAAPNGDGFAQAELGNFYLNGIGIDRDVGLALKWFMAAAEQGNAFAQSRLGLIYRDGIGVENSIENAIYWYRKAANQGNSSAIFGLGLSLMRLNLAANDMLIHNHRSIWANLIDNTNSLLAKAMLGFWIERGYIFERDLDKARSLYESLGDGVGTHLSEDETQKNLSKLVGKHKTEEFNLRIPLSPLGKDLINSTGVMEVSQHYLALTDYLRSLHKYKSIMDAHQMANSETVWHTPSELIKSTHEYWSSESNHNVDTPAQNLYRQALLELRQLLNDNDELVKLSETSKDFLHIIQENIRWKAKNAFDSGRTYASLRIGRNLVSKYRFPHYLHIEGLKIIWNNLLTQTFSLRSAQDLSEITHELGEINRVLISREAIISSALVERFIYNSSKTSSHPDFPSSSVRPDASLDKIPHKDFCIYAINAIGRHEAGYPIEWQRARAMTRVRAIASALDDLRECYSVLPNDYVYLIEAYINSLSDAGLLSDSKEALEVLEARSSNVNLSTRDRISRYRKRYHLFANAGLNEEAFIEIIRHRSLAYSSGDRDLLLENSRWLSSTLLNIGDYKAAIKLLFDELPFVDSSESSFQYCLMVSLLRRAFLAIGEASNTIALQKSCVEGLHRQFGSVISDQQNPFFRILESFFRNLIKDLENNGRLSEAGLIHDYLKEDEHFDFIRRSGGSDPRSTRIGYTVTEARWMSRYREIADRLAALGREELALQKQAKLGLSEEQKKRQAALAADLRVAQAGFESFLDQMRQEFAAKGPSRFVELEESSVKALAELQDLLKGLGDDVALLRIYLTDEQVNFLLTTPGVQLARNVKIKTQDLSRQVAELNRLLRDPKADPLPAAQALYKLLLAPVEQDLQQAGAKTVMLSLDGVLRYLPFGVLHDGQRYALQRWNLPVYTSVVRERLRESANANWQAAGLGVTRKHGNFDPLPAVRTEMSSIIRTGATGVLPGEVHLDEAFTAQRLKDVSQRRFPVVHVASHFQFSPGTEINSFLLLGDGTQLTLGDIRTQNYRFDDVDLLTLSACETGLGGGRDQRGREIEGFGVIAQQQGAKAVLATLWKVADSSTATLMGDMYRRRVQSGLSKIEALRQAQMSMAAQPRTAHPFYWAPFVLMGNWK
jgi:CHAT domain-containing protein